MLAASVPALAVPRYSVTTLPEGTYPLAINNAGQIVGEYSTGFARSGFAWSGGVFTELDSPDFTEGTATAINGAGQIAGYARSFVVDNEVRAVTWSGKTPTELSVFGGSGSSIVTGINRAGDLSGQYVRDDGARAFARLGGVDVDLGTLGGDFAYAAAINSAGHVVGISALDNETTWLSHAFLYANGKMTDLGTLGGSLSSATAINDRGQIVGNAWVQGSDHAFLYENGVMTDLGTLGGRRSFANGINLAGQIVGIANDISDADYLAFVLDPGGVMTDLNTLIDPALGWTLYNAAAINDAGQIAAFGCRGENDCMGLLLAPVPEPGTWAMLLAGLGALGWARLAKRRAAAASGQLPEPVAGR